MKISEYVVTVIGGGVVGNATAKSYAEYVKEVRVWDIDPTKVVRSQTFTGERLSDAVEGATVVFICVGTPALGDGGLDTSFVESVVKELPKIGPRYVIKSTMPIGMTAALAKKYKIGLSHSPEFLTARCAAHDAQNPTQNIIGYHTLNEISGRLADPLYDLYKQRWPHIPIRCVLSPESEAIKLFTNGFFATKVAYWNEVRSLVEAIPGMSWERIIPYILANGRIHPSHTQVPGPDGQYGFGGTCLPKDTHELCHAFELVGLDAKVMKAALARNIADRTKLVSNPSEEIL